MDLCQSFNALTLDDMSMDCNDTAPLDLSYKNPMDLIVQIDGEKDNPVVTFSNENVSFSLIGTDKSEYAEAGDACILGFDFNGKSISVRHNTVFVTIINIGDRFSGRITYKIDAKHCGNAFITASAGWMTFDEF